MKALKPTHREKKRYLLLKGKDANLKSIENSILDYIGLLGYSKSSPMLVKKSKSSIIISVNRKSLDKIKASILLSDKDIKITKISGTIKKLGS